MNAVLRDELMSKHTSWRLGGPADLYFRPESVDALCDFLRDLNEGVDVYWTGVGSNLLVRDGGIRGAVISPVASLGNLERHDAGLVEAGAGVPCTVLARRCTRWGLGPAEFFAGIPGTVGGALKMNAGAFGGETWDRVVEVDTVDRQGQIRTRPKADFDVAYRQVHGPADEWFVAARFQFVQQPEARMERVQELMKERQQKQPLGLPSCGSVFRNPPGQHAAQLIEAAGLKGCQVGGAVVSEKHANFIINTGDATSADVEALIDRVRSAVSERHGIELELEVHIVGEQA
jgi:UDP-N-acetylmuramate dehydrogenase